MQGDVFDGISVPGLSDDPITVMITTHPCSMRRGTKLADRIAVAPVLPCSRIGQSTWQRHGNVMPLPGLQNSDSDYHADFRSISSISSKEIDLERRVSVL